MEGEADQVKVEEEEDQEKKKTWPSRPWLFVRFKEEEEEERRGKKKKKKRMLVKGAGPP